LIKHAPKSRVQQSIQGLAQALYGKPVAAASDTKGSKGGWGFFGKR
jgi:pilus assembly protein CpaE